MSNPKEEIPDPSYDTIGGEYGHQIGNMFEIIVSYYELYSESLKGDDKNKIQGALDDLNKTKTDLIKRIDLFEKIVEKAQDSGNDKFKPTNRINKNSLDLLRSFGDKNWTDDDIFLELTMTFSDIAGIKKKDRWVPKK